MKPNVKEPNKPTTIHLSSGIWGWMLTFFIVGIRIVQPNALPIEEWSAMSWVYMTLPITWPWVLFILAKAVYLVLLLLELIYELAIKPFNKR